MTLITGKSPIEEKSDIALLKDLMIVEFKKIDKRIDDQLRWLGEIRDWQHVLEKRLEAIENSGKQPAPWAMDSSVCELQRRIETLEKVDLENWDELQRPINHQAVQMNIMNGRIKSLEAKLAFKDDKHPLLGDLEKFAGMAIKVTAEHIVPKTNENVLPDQDTWVLRCGNCSEIIIRCHAALYRHREFEIYCEKCAEKIDNHNPDKVNESSGQGDNVI